jgi:hypothetical protein
MLPLFYKLEITVEQYLRLKISVGVPLGHVVIPPFSIPSASRAGQITVEYPRNKC